MSLRNPVPVLTSKKPIIGETISSYAFPKTYIEFDENTSVYINDTWHFGEIEDFHENGISILSNPCYQSSMYIQHGSSGGPVMNADGKIIAINSSGSDVGDGLAPYSFLTPITHCFELEVKDGNGQMHSIRSLIEKGIIVVE